MLFFGAAVFWSAFEQAGSTLTLFADQHTDLTLGTFLIPSSWFQSLNAIFIFMLAPVFAGLWVWLAHRRQEPSTPAKFSIGLLFVGLGFLLLVVGSAIAERGIKVSPFWLVGVYMLHTLGELTLSPVGLSAMTKLAPARVVSLMMAVVVPRRLGRQLHRRLHDALLRLADAAAALRRRRRVLDRRGRDHAAAREADQADDGNLRGCPLRLRPAPVPTAPAASGRGGPIF